MHGTVKKPWILCVTVLLLLAMLAGCGSNVPKESPNAQPDSTVSAAPVTSEAPKAENAPSTEKRVLRLMGPESANPYIKFTNREDFLVWKEFKKLFDAKGLDPQFEIIAQDQYETTLQTRMAAGTDLPDFLNVTKLDDATILNYAEQGILIPLNEIINKNSDGTAKAFFTDGKGMLSNRLNTAEDGNVYWISQVQATTYDNKPGSTSMTINIRKDWLDKLGLPVPTTAEEFRNTLQAFRDKDANGNGEKDEMLAFNPAVFDNGIAQWFGLVATGDVTSFVIEDGKVTSPWYQEGVKDYFAYLNKLANENLMDVSLIGLKTGDQLDAKIAQNKASAIYTYVMQTWYEPSVAAEGALYLPLAPLKAVDKIIPVLAIEPPSLSYSRWAFTRECKDTQAAADLLDILCGEEYETLTQWGIEGTTFEVVDGNRKLLDIALNANWEQAAKEGKAIGDMLWANGSMFPKRRFVPMENEMGVVPKEKADFQRSVINYHPTTPLGTENYLPIATKEQVQRRLEIMTDLKTRSEELATQLILGQASLDNWDSYIKELKDLGLDELIAINQSLLDRYNKK